MARSGGQTLSYVCPYTWYSIHEFKSAFLAYKSIRCDQCHSQPSDLVLYTYRRQATQCNHEYRPILLFLQVQQQRLDRVLSLRNGRSPCCSRLLFPCHTGGFRCASKSRGSQSCLVQRCALMEAQICQIQGSVCISYFVMKINIV